MMYNILLEIVWWALFIVTWFVRISLLVVKIQVEWSLQQCTVLSICYIVATSGVGTKFKENKYWYNMLP